MTTYEDIAEQLRQPIPQLMEWLYERYAKKWYGLAVSKWHLDPDTAWEIIYQTLDTLIAKRTILPTTPKAYFENYILKVYVNCLKQHLREQARLDEIFQIVPLEIDPAESSDEETNEINFNIGEDVFEQFHEHDDLQSLNLLRLENALAKLDETDRSLLLLKVQQFSYNEIASMLGVENNQLKVRHHRAKQKLINLYNQAES